MYAEDSKIVPLLNSANISTGTDCDSIDMANFHKATFIFTFGTVTTDITVTAKSGVSAGTKTNNVLYQHALGGAAIGTAVAGSAASCDVLAAWSQTTALAPAPTIAAVSNLMLVIEIDAKAITPGDSWLTLTIAAGTSGIAHCVAVLQPRYTGARSVTALA